MSTFIGKVRTASGAWAVQLATKDGRDLVGIDHVGSAHTAEELELLLAEARRRMNAGQMALPGLDGADARPRMVSSSSRLLFDAIAHACRALGPDALCDATFKDLVVARAIEPVSKLDTIRVLGELGLEPPSYSAISRAPQRCAERDYRGRIQRELLAHAPAGSPAPLPCDLTTLYFEIQKEDGYRKPGLSKERRLEPQITVGLLTGRDGYPLEVRGFEGNRAEVRTVMEVLSSFRERYGEGPITAAADAAMLSAKNLGELEAQGLGYIIGSRLAKCPCEIAELELETGGPPADGETFDLEREFDIDGHRARRRVACQYREKRARLDLRNIERAADKARRMAEGKTPYKRNRFLTVTGGERTVNEALIEENRLKAGIRGYVTSLAKDEATPQEVIGAYHELWHVEQSLRMSKTDLRARPIFHRKRDSIEAHLTIVLAALAVSRRIQHLTGITIRRFKNALRPLRTGIVSINGAEIEIPPQLSEEASDLLELIDFDANSPW